MVDAPPSPNELLQTLSVLLDREREALLEGELATIPEIMAEKSRLIDSLAGVEIDRIEAVRPLHLKLRRNQALFDQSLAGIRSVAKRLGGLRDAGKLMEVYDVTGRRARIGSAEKGRLERRA
ncbi:MAG: flagellar protein FlgN [Rhodobacteraceae bacterium]|jgi:flagellar biosynthesis/type III secretory pathway chaperone|uniref:flagellar protein FlgN n=1 Tax=Salipiger TaxID=263377 RepID=UPI0008ED9783|nr:MULTISPECIES: flagellar protein FlgN [Salipiger]MAB05940.1 flagellar protein FlgN [Paracoccaceae bacterium]GGA10614.1 hypothetical protein GCM10011326_23100 [Salipiger profundus]SFC65813.1 hypothetical protein SAMN05444415_104250 [Salipiger profundus]